MSTADVASGYVKIMVEREGRGWGDTSNALARLERRYGVSRWTMDRLRTGRAKTIQADLYKKIRGAYLDMCERQIKSLTHELAIEKAKNHADYNADLALEAEALAAKIAQLKKENMT